MAHSILVYEMGRARSHIEKLTDIKRLLGLGVSLGHKGIHLVIAEDHRNGVEHGEWNAKKGYRYAGRIKCAADRMYLAWLEQGVKDHPHIGDLLLTLFVNFKGSKGRLDHTFVVCSRAARRRRVQVELEGKVVPARKRLRKRVKGVGGGYHGHGPK